LATSRMVGHWDSSRCAVVWRAGRVSTSPRTRGRLRSRRLPWPRLLSLGLLAHGATCRLAGKSGSPSCPVSSPISPAEATPISEVLPPKAGRTKRWVWTADQKEWIVSGSGEGIKGRRTSFAGRTKALEGSSPTRSVTGRSQCHFSLLYFSRFQTHSDFFNASARSPRAPPPPRSKAA
jgi:hypothetical protein